MSVNELLVYELTTPLNFDPEKAYVLYELKFREFAFLSSYVKHRMVDVPPVILKFLQILESRFSKVRHFLSKFSSILYLFGGFLLS